MTSLNEKHNEHKVLGMDDVMPSTRYKGYLVRDLLESDPGYVRLCIENDWLSFDEEVEEVLERNG